MTLQECYEKIGGDYNDNLIKSAESCGYYTIQWSVDSLDWKDYGADNIVSTVLNHKNLDNGAIILMHNGARYTKDALERVIVGLMEQGYTIVPISELIPDCACTMARFCQPYFTGVLATTSASCALMR